MKSIYLSIKPNKTTTSCKHGNIRSNWTVHILSYVIHYLTLQYINFIDVILRDEAITQAFQINVRWIFFSFIGRDMGMFIGHLITKQIFVEYIFREEVQLYVKLLHAMCWHMQLCIMQMLSNPRNVSWKVYCGWLDLLLLNSYSVIYTCVY